MEWGNLTTVTALMALASSCVRWRWPAVPAYLASAGIGASLCGVVLSFLHPSIALALSLTANAALLAGAADAYFSRIGKRAHEPEAAGSAVLVLNFPANGPPTEVSNVNVHSWSARTLALTACMEDGSQTSHIFNQWLIPIWFDRPVFDYQLEVVPLTPCAVLFDVNWRTERGVFLTIQPPQEPAVFKVSISRR
jgi:hypothetical protein